MSLTDKTLQELSDGLAQKTYSSVELTQAFLTRIEQLDKKLNTFITVTPELALAQAKEADARRARGEQGPLLGIPIAHKDIFCTNGVRTSCASKMLDNFIPPYNATVVEQLNHVGTVLLGKTNMDEFAMGSANENSYYGCVRNPWRLTHSPGGSSGGSAAAVSARLVPAATGTDTGGSVRQPAAWSGITGLKPSYGLVSRYGMIAFASSLDQGGPLARTAEDCALLLGGMAGFDPRDSTSVNQPVPDYRVEIKTSLKGLRVGLPSVFFNEGLHPAVANAIQTAIATLKSLGAICQEVDLSYSRLAVSAYYVIAPAEASSNLARYDGVRYGYRCEQPKDLEDLYKRSRGEGFGKEVKRRIMMGTYVLSSGYYDAYYRKAQQIRHLIHNDFAKAFEQVDVIVGPTTPTTAFALGEKADPLTVYLNDIYTIPANLAGIPGLSMPVGLHEGLPIGMQLLGPRFSESTLLRVAHQYQLATEWHSMQPPLEGVV